MGDGCFHWCRRLCVFVLFALSEVTTVVTAVVMILRVWALYGRSRIILGVLLALYVMEIIPFIIACIILSTPDGSIGM